MKIGITDALLALRPNAKFLVRGNVYTGIEWKDESQSLPSEDDVNAKITELLNAHPMKLLREKRNSLLNKTDWRASSDLIMSDAWRSYRQALRDLPSYSTPTLDSNNNLDLTSVEWPTAPS